MLRKILKENWKSYLKTHTPTEHQRIEVNKMINCSRSSCNSRFCTSCGKRYTDDWSNFIKSKLLNTQNKHVVLTVPSFLRQHLRNWNKLSILMKSSWDFLKCSN
jgi:hypothetical protein